MSDVAPGRAFLEASRRYLADEYPRKIERALRGLGPDDLWWRPNPASNAIGNLVVHLAGNVRQWIVHGLGGAPDVRRRQAEFDRREGDVDDLLARLWEAVTDAADVLAALDPATLNRPCTIQGVETTGLEAVYHVVEHFSMHTGQILYLAKLRTGRDLGFYDVDADGSVVDTNW